MNKYQQISEARRLLALPERATMEEIKKHAGEAGMTLEEYRFACRRAVAAEMESVPIRGKTPKANAIPFPEQRGKQPDDSTE